jgi:hypothetical protein
MTARQAGGQPSPKGSASQRSQQEASNGHAKQFGYFAMRTEAVCRLDLALKSIQMTLSE